MPAGSEFPIPDFDDDEEQVKYVRFLSLFKQEYLNNIVVMLFLNRLIEASNADREFVFKMIKNMSDSFEQQMAKHLVKYDMATGEKTEPPLTGVLEDPDVQRLLGGLIGSDGITADDVEDKTVGLALKNVCEVYKGIMEKSADNMLGLARKILDKRQQGTGQ